MTTIKKYITEEVLVKTNLVTGTDLVKEKVEERWGHSVFFPLPRVSSTRNFVPSYLSRLFSTRDKLINEEILDTTIIVPRLTSSINR